MKSALLILLILLTIALLQGVTGSSLEKTYLAKSDPGLLVVVGSTEAHKHIEPSLYVDWQALLLDDTSVVPVTSQWFEAQSGDSRGFSFIGGKNLAEACEMQLSGQPKLVKIVSKNSKVIDSEDKWVEACSPHAILSVDGKVNERLEKLKNYKKIKADGEESFFVKEGHESSFPEVSQESDTNSILEATKNVKEATVITILQEYVSIADILVHFQGSSKKEIILNQPQGSLIVVGNLAYTLSS